MSVALPRPWQGTVQVPLLFSLAGLAAMYLPSYWEAAFGLWQTEEFGHAPLILVVAAWLFWRLCHAIEDAPTLGSALGWPLLFGGLVVYLFGRVFGISSAEFLSQPLVVAATLLVLKGSGALRAAWFPVLYLLFMVPLPASMVDAMTGPLKQWISMLVVDLLDGFGYPIARTGVLISVGQYQLLVADACSGLNSMISLSALGTLFIYVTGRASRLHNALMLALILPIAFVANIVRVLALILVTYHLGDEAGQGFLHGAAGILLMLVALAILLAFDYTLHRGLSAAARKRTRP